MQIQLHQKQFTTLNSLTHIHIYFTILVRTLHGHPLILYQVNAIVYGLTHPLTQNLPITAMCKTLCFSRLVILFNL